MITCSVMESGCVNYIRLLKSHGEFYLERDSPKSRKRSYEDDEDSYYYQFAVPFCV